MIVKIQRPLASTEPEPKALVYNRSRSFQAFMPMTDDINTLFSDGSHKVFHQVKLVKTELHIGKRIYPEVEW